MTLNNYCTSTMKIITLLSTSIEKHFILIFKTLVSHDVFMAHFSHVQAMDRAMVILFYGIPSFECSEILLQD